MPPAIVLRFHMVFCTLVKCMPLKGSPQSTEKEDKGDAKCVKYLVVTVNVKQHFTFMKANCAQGEIMG